ncbi:hypothetical protein ACER0C_009767 [Sarotherodon galilaeus]
MDPLFGNEFMNLTSMDEIQDRGTIRMTSLAEGLTTQSSEAHSISADASCSFGLDDSTSRSSGCVDTDILSSPELEASCSSTSRALWPRVFCVPEFSFDAELKLEQGNAAYKEKGTLLTSDPELKSQILEGLIQEIVRYKIYVTDKDLNTVGEALISKHPCVTETSLKIKLASYCTHLRKLGWPEVVVDSVTHKPGGKSSAAFANKRPRRSEVNYCPPYPVGESKDSLETLRVELLSDVKKANNREVVRMKMEKTFAYRRHEVVCDTPIISDFQARWSALFEVSEINAEFKPITTMPLQFRFLSQIDVLSDKLTKVFKTRGGQIGRRLQNVLEPMDDVDLVHECIIKGLCVYLNEDPSNLVTEYVRSPEDIGIVIEGQRVLQDLDNCALAAAKLFGLMYTLNLTYPPELKYTFEVLQKLVMELEGNSLSKKAQVLKNRLYE